MIELDLTLIIILLFVATAAGFFDTVCGGGGLITLPALVLMGLDPTTAIATNKLQASASNISATVSFSRRGLIDWTKSGPIALFALMGSLLGAIAISVIPKQALTMVIPFLLVGTAAYFAFAPTLDSKDRSPRLPLFIFAFSIVPILGFYDGAFGPGSGSFFLLAFVVILGQGVLHAIANTKLINTASNLGALCIFAFSGAIYWPAAMALVIGGVIGGQLGAMFAMQTGAKFIKPMLVTVCVLTATKMVFLGSDTVQAKQPGPHRNGAAPALSEPVN